METVQDMRIERTLPEVPQSAHNDQVIPLFRSDDPKPHWSAKTFWALDIILRTVGLLSLCFLAYPHGLALSALVVLTGLYVFLKCNPSWKDSSCILGVELALQFMGICGLSFFSPYSTGAFLSVMVVAGSYYFVHDNQKPLSGLLEIVARAFLIKREPMKKEGIGLLVKLMFLLIGIAGTLSHTEGGYSAYLSQKELANEN